MDKIKIPKNYTGFESFNYVYQLCRPLFINTNIDIFSYARYYEDGSIFRLSSDLAFEEFNLCEKKRGFLF